MSLQLAAQHIADKGRGPDTTLVHMSNNEVKSLNDLANAHGGSLTVNPETGLPEAGFLSSILPMVAGVALNAVAPGLGAAASGALVGGASMLLNPKAGLMGGLMAGLGAYGGANLGEALASQGVEQATTSKLAEDQAYKQALADQQLKSEAIGKAFQSGSITADEFGKQAMAAASPAQTLYGNAMQSVTPTDTLGRLGSMGQGIGATFTQPGGFSNLASKLGGTSGVLQTGLAAAAPLAIQPTVAPPAATTDKDMGQRYTYSANKATPLPAPDVPTYQDMMNKQGNFGAEQKYFANPEFKAITNEQAKDIYHFAAGGPVERMSNNAAIGANTMYPMANMVTSAFATPYQTPQSTNMLSSMTPSGGGTVDAMSGEPNMQGTRLATGGISDAGYNLGGYSDGGRLLRGPGDGVSDSIPATIGHKQPARLADGEFVVPARIVSELGNGSTEAGARKLYAMMDRVQAARKNTIGKGKVAKNNRADKYLPA